MNNALVRYWWIQALRGVFAVLLGVMAFAWPRFTLSTLVFLFGAYAFADGIFALIGAVQQRERWWALAIEGVAGLAAGSVAFVWPDLTAIALVYLIAAWAIVTGVLEVITAIRLRNTIEDEIFLGMAGVASIVFGALIMAWPAVGVVTLLSLIGAFAFVYGAMMIVLGFKLRKYNKFIETDDTGHSIPIRMN